MYQVANDLYSIRRYGKDDQREFQQLEKRRYDVTLPIGERIHICNTWLPIFCVILVENDETIYVVDKLGGYLYSDDTGDPLEVYINEIIEKHQCPPG